MFAHARTGLSELLKSLGIPLVVDDLYSLDSESLAALQPIRALIFLFKWIGGGDEAGGGEGKYDEDFPGFFAHQVRATPTHQNRTASKSVD